MTDRTDDYSVRANALEFEKDQLDFFPRESGEEGRSEHTSELDELAQVVQLKSKEPKAKSPTRGPAKGGVPS